MKKSNHKSKLNAFSKRFQFLSTMGIVLCFLVFVVACKKDKEPVDIPPDNIDDQELITSVALIFTPQNDTSMREEFWFKDLDGIGGNSPNVWDTIVLQPQVLYVVEAVFLNESINPVESITEEIIEEADQHLVCYTKAGLTFPITITDYDSNNLPLGLKTTWSTNNNEEGSVVLSLKHQAENKNGSCNIGETDVEIAFPCVVRP